MNCIADSIIFFFKSALLLVYFNLKQGSRKVHIERRFCMSSLSLRCDKSSKTDFLISFVKEVSSSFGSRILVFKLCNTGTMADTVTWFSPD